MMYLFSLAFNNLLFLISAILSPHFQALCRKAVCCFSKADRRKNISKQSENFINNFSTLPFSEYESKLISAFLFHQKLSDLVYSIEHDKYKTNPKELHNLIYNTDYSTYLKKYLLSSNSVEDLNKSTSLLSLSDYFINKNNYKIYHSVNDYLTNKKQLSTLKQMCEDKLILFDNGSHLGFTYRDEFLNELKKEIAIKK